MRLLAWRDAAREKSLAGRVILNGSFISAKPNPGDFDLLFLYDTASEAIVRQDEEALALIDPLRCKAVYGGDVFAFSLTMVAAYPQFFPIDGFDRVKFTDMEKRRIGGRPMIENEAQLAAALDYIAKWADTLEGMRRHEAEQHGGFSPTLAAGPLGEIRANLEAARIFAHTVGDAMARTANSEPSRVLSAA